ncbi:serine hydrolase domain-containing protein [Chloroflexota bacterium]
MSPRYPDSTWAAAAPQEADFDEASFAAAHSWQIEQSAGRAYRTIVVRGGRVVAAWEQGILPTAHVQLASAAKSVFSCMLAIALDEGKIEAADAPVVDVYPAMMDVPAGCGPKSGRYAFPKDRAITFRQLISNTSGYMKPGEEPGKVFHYQTYGMNILTHAIAQVYGCYDSADPTGSPGLAPLVSEKLRDPIGADWGYYTGNFDLHPAARINIFGNYDGISATTAGMARLGWLWRHMGRWADRQLVPADWLAEATRVNLDIRANGSPDQQRYGYGFWTNETGVLWPDLPTDSFAAIGAGSQIIWVCPSLDLVIVESPGLWTKHEEVNQGLIARIVAASR